MFSKIIPHAGKFHADDVAATAMLQIVSAGAIVTRKFASEVAEDLTNPYVLVLDHGKQYDPSLHNYDHHQEQYRDEDGFCLAATGLIWRHFGERVVATCLGQAAPDSQPTPSEIAQVAERLRVGLIRALDTNDADGSYQFRATCDAGEVAMPTLPSIIRNMNSSDIKNREEQDRRFFEACELVQGILFRAIEYSYRKMQGESEFRQIVKEKAEGKILTLSKFLPWQEIVCAEYPEAQMIIFPTPRPETPWGVQMVPDSPGSRKFRGGHPGLEDAPGLNTPFIHVGKFIAGCRTLEEAAALAAHNIR